MFLNPVEDPKEYISLEAWELAEARLASKDAKMYEAQAKWKELNDMDEDAMEGW